MNAIKIKNLTKKYGKTIAVENLDLSVEKGDFFGFIGPNGAGKTTTIKSILNLIVHNSGDIEIFETPNKLYKFQKEIGYVPGEANLYEGLTVAKQIKYFSSYYKNIDQNYIKKLIKMFDIDSSKKIRGLSLGNKKKVSIVCALLNKPKLLLFDEVSNSLDPLMQKNLFDELKRLNQQGVTIFFSSHNLDEVQRYCKNVAMIRQGKIVNKDSVANLIKSVGVQIILKTKHKFSPQFYNNFDIKPTFHSDGSIIFKYSGDINRLVASLANKQLDFIRINDVMLEDIFNDYFEDKNQ